MLINVKMPTIVGILTFMSRINFVLSCVEYEKSFITLELIWDQTVWHSDGMTKNFKKKKKKNNFEK